LDDQNSVPGTKSNFCIHHHIQKGSEEHPDSNPVVTVGVLPMALNYSLSYIYNRNLSTPYYLHGMVPVPATNLLSSIKPEGSSLIISNLDEFWCLHHSKSVHKWEV
jgi:membrane protease YdiL (CAAX protease family)